MCKTSCIMYVQDLMYVQDVLHHVCARRLAMCKKSCYIATVGNRSSMTTSLRLHTHKHTHTHIHARIRMCIYVYIYAYMYVYTCICICAYKCAYMIAPLAPHSRSIRITYTHIRTHTHISLHTYTHRRTCTRTPMAKGLGRGRMICVSTPTHAYKHTNITTHAHTHTHTHTWRKMRIISSSPCSRSNTLKHTATHCNTLQTHSKTHTSRRGKFSTTLSPSGRIRQVQNTTSYHKYRTRQVVTSTEHDKLSQVL